jgi:hypothetical protein
MIFPQSLTHLILSEDFNQPINRVIFPPSLTHLTFGCDFDQPIDNVIFPPSLTHLELSYEFNHSLDNISDTITHLTIYNLKFPLNNLPFSLKELNLYYTD